MNRLAVAALLVFMLCPGAFAQQPLDSTQAAPAAAPVRQEQPKQDATSSTLARWVDVQAVTLAARYRRIETSQGVVTSNEGQGSIAVRGRFKFDRGGRFSLNAGVATGNSLTSGWNSTGIGSGEFARTLSVKQLFAAASPVRGLDVEYGGLAAVRGETTEVTNVDNDTYLVGERATVRRPENLWFDEITLTLAYLGDPLTPNVFSRLHRLSEANYRQYVIGRKVKKVIGLSAEYDRYQGVGTIRTGVSVRSSRMRALDLLRAEHYSRLGTGGASGFGLYAEKAVVPRLVVAGGYANIDPKHQISNGDRYLKGKRLYTLNTVKVTAALSVSVYFTRAVATTFAIPNRTRWEVVAAYNALNVVRRIAGLR